MCGRMCELARALWARFQRVDTNNFKVKASLVLGSTLRKWHTTILTLCAFWLVIILVVQIRHGDSKIVPAFEVGLHFST